MRIESIAEILERIEAELAEFGSNVATDADGTLWSGDVGVDVFEAILCARGIREPARKALEREAAEASVDVTSDIHELARQIRAAAENGRYPEDRSYEMVAWVFAGWTPEEAYDFARELCRNRGLEERIRPEMRDIVCWLRTRGIEPWVVSASPNFMVQAGVALLGIPPDRVIGARPGVCDGRFVPWLSTQIPFGDGKVRALDVATGCGRIVAAFGDELFDLQMLKRARVPVAVGPSQRLLNCAGELVGLVELSLSEHRR
ncbi:MAG: haloacid dehalogenase-like hydrolase [Polyangiaceae bacterium]|nr:haloacid dehalogenase-like hydrolase [Polyangiaceae bacterium]